MLLTQDLINNMISHLQSQSGLKGRTFGYKEVAGCTDDVTHNEDGAMIKLKVPGFNKKSIDISVDSETLTIEGKTEDDAFSKRYSVDTKFDFESIDAKVVDGLLTLSLPFRDEIKPRKIKVN